MVHQCMIGNNNIQVSRGAPVLLLPWILTNSNLFPAVQEYIFALTVLATTSKYNFLFSLKRTA